MIYLEVKSNRWKSREEVTCGDRSKVGLCMKKD